MLVQPDYETIKTSLQWHCPHPDQVFEVRSLMFYRGLASTGYFNDPVIAANAICTNDSDGIGGTYVTLNPVLPEALARSTNHMVPAKAGSFTSDKEILERRYLLLDFDPVRISGISSTDEEHERALNYMQEVTENLEFLYGFPVPCLIDSGNGGHAKYRLETLPNTLDSTELIKTTLQALDTRYSTGMVVIDRSVFNASRIVRIPGTVARKGENTPDRPHRVSRIIRPFDPMDRLRADTMRKLVRYIAPTAPQKPSTGTRHIFEYPPDENAYRALNSAARGRVTEWVPQILVELARDVGDGWRIDSDTLGRELEEAISITAAGSIKDFGVADMGDATEGRRTPISLVADIMYNGDKSQAVDKLSAVLNIPRNEFDGKIIQPPSTMPPELMGVPIGPFAAVRCFADVMHLPVRPVTFTVRGFIADNTHTVLSAPAKLGKSTLMYAMCLHLLFGKPLWGRPVTTCNVLFCALEETDERFRRKLYEQFDNLNEQWGITDDERERAFKGFRFFTKDSRNQNGVLGTLPQGRDGAEEIKRIIREDVSKPWFVLIEPVNKFHDHSMYSRNLNALEYEQIEIINDIIKATEYTCSIVTIKHDRKTPAGGIRGTANLMDSISGSVAQSGAPDAQIQFISTGGFDNLDGLNWLIVQSRDFGKEKIPIISDGISWVKPPPDYEIPDFDEYINTPRDGRGAQLKDPLIDQKIIGELSKEINGLRARELENRLNIPYQRVLRRLKHLHIHGVVHEDRRSLRDVVYLIVGAATMPVVNTLPDLI